MWKEVEDDGNRASDECCEEKWDDELVGSCVEEG